MRYVPVAKRLNKGLMSVSTDVRVELESTRRGKPCKRRRARQTRSRSQDESWEGLVLPTKRALPASRNAGVWRGSGGGLEGNVVDVDTRRSQHRLQKSREVCTVCEGNTCPGLVRKLHDVETSPDPKGVFKVLIGQCTLVHQRDCTLRPLGFHSSGLLSTAWTRGTGVSVHCWLATPTIGTPTPRIAKLVG